MSNSNFSLFSFPPLMLDGFLSEERDQSLMNVIEVITAQRIFILQNIAKKTFGLFLFRINSCVNI